MNRTCIILAGPTAVGKTDIAVQLARYFKTAVISADSRQCYRELNIGVAKPSDQYLAEVPHYFINTHSIHQTVTAADFEKYALDIAEKLFQRSDHIIVSGGTGLYIKAFCEGLDEVPEVAEAIRLNIIENFKSKGIQWLRDQLKIHDPEYYSIGEIKNPQRMMRALEIIIATGRSITEFKKGEKKKRDFEIKKILLDLPRDDLYARIDLRVDNMITSGLAEEVKGLLPFKNLNALQTVGYTEIFEFLEGNISYDEAIHDIKKNTRHYAKRQKTWFKKDGEFIICSPVFEQVLRALKT